MEWTLLFATFILPTIYLWGGIYLIVKFMFPLLEEDSSISDTIKFFSILSWSIIGLIFFSYKELFIGLSLGVVLIQMVGTFIEIYTTNKREKELSLEYKYLKHEIRYTMEYSFLIKNNRLYSFTKKQILKQIEEINGLTNLKQIDSRETSTNTSIVEKINFDYDLLNENKITDEIETIIRSNKNALFINNTNK